MDDTEMVDLLRTSERLATVSGKASLVAFWLSLMPSERAAQIQSKMALKPED
jgi:flagellar protein FlbB